MKIQDIVENLKSKIKSSLFKENKNIEIKEQ
jgi:hypothetical protein